MMLLLALGLGLAAELHADPVASPDLAIFFVDDMGYGTSFGFRLPGHFFSQADEVKPALFVPLWGFLGEVRQRCKYVGSVGRPGGARGCGAGARGGRNASSRHRNTWVTVTPRGQDRRPID